MVRKFQCARCFETLEHEQTQKPFDCENCGALLKMESWTDAENYGWKSVLMPEFRSLPSGQFEPWFKELRLLDEEWEKVDQRDRETGTTPAFAALGLFFFILFGAMEAAAQTGGMVMIIGIVLAAVIIIPSLIRSSGDTALNQKRSEYGTRRKALLQKLSDFRSDPELSGYITGA